MKLNKREEFMLWKLLDFSIHRYLFTFAKWRRDGHERAEQHIAISKLLWEVEFCQTTTPEHHEEWMAIHDLIADQISNHLPRTIGMDLDADEHDFDVLADKFFKLLIKLDLRKSPPKKGAK